MDKTGAKHRAQNLLMYAAANALYHLNDDPDLLPDQREQVAKAIEHQYRRIEKLFGYEPGSWNLA